MKTIQLNNNTYIPVAGMGTFLMESNDAYNAVLNALDSGYTLIDTANAYMNEKAVGKAIKDSKVKREDIYLSTKLWPSIYDDAAHQIDETLNRLDTDYIDLLFLHQPIGDYIGAYKAIEDAVRDGKVKSIGLSNFSIDQIKDLVQQTSIKPAVIQVEAHPYYPQTELKEYLKEFGAIIMAWYPLGHGDKNLINEEVITTLANKYNKSNAQIILKWHIQNNHIVIPGSKNKDHIKDNIDLFDFELSQDDLSLINQLDKNKTYYVQTQEALNNYLNLKLDFNNQ